MRPFLAGLFALLLVAGCSKMQVQTYSKQASPERTFGGIKKVAVLPLDTLSEAGVGPKNAENTLIQKLLTQRTFDVVKEPRYVTALMKKLKLRPADGLDKEIVQKIGQELQVDAVLVGSLLLFGEDVKSGTVEFSIFLNMLDVGTGDIVWSGSTFVRSSTTWAEVFGLSKGPSVNELAVQGIVDLADQINSSFVKNRQDENKIIMSQAAANAAAEEEEEKDAEKVDEKDTEDLLLKVKPK